MKPPLPSALELVACSLSAPAGILETSPATHIYHAPLFRLDLSSRRRIRVEVILCRHPASTSSSIVLYNIAGQQLLRNQSIYSRPVYCGQTVMLASYSMCRAIARGGGMDHDVLDPI